jgi:8-oxo-dGTP diphosphatase
MPRADQRIKDQRYHVIPRTLIFLFNDREQVLLIKGAENKRRWGGLYNGIGGHIEAGEEILEAAQRELLEETGIPDLDLIYCGQVMIDVSQEEGVAIFIFRGAYTGEGFIPSKEGELFWFDLDGLEEIPLVEDLAYLLPRIVRYKEGDPVIIGKYQYTDSEKLIISFL